MKYAGKTIIEIAQERGSSAKTKAGAWKYLLAHLGRKPFGYRPIPQDKYATQNWIETRRERSLCGRAKILGYMPIDAPYGWISDQYAWYSEAYKMNHDWDRACEREIVRSEYGATYSRTGSRTERPRPETILFDEAWSLIREAEQQKKIPGSYDSISFDRKGRADGGAIHHELYDFVKNAAVACIRETEGSRYGVKTISKKYMIIVRGEDGEIAAEYTTEPVAKLAKAGKPFGSIVARILGLDGAATLATGSRIDIAYKALALVDGELRSIFSGELYELGQEKRQVAQSNHSGGYYCYDNLYDAKNCEVPTESVYRSAPRVVVKCEVHGKKIVYGTGKMARTYLKPIEIVA